ncbi:anti-sigma factor [Microbacterium tenebrionis]|uniref:anti-sigma factor n=1 Tax=Microbacterium tenebrionis TaxID=2830665 RepID=UPI00158933B6|nr:anti-sigma factor [Microbacterium ihumii]
MNESEFAELAAGRALHALSDADERRYADALAAHPEWAAIAEHDAETAALLADGSPAVAPPAGVRDALLARIAVTPQGEPTSPTGVAPDAGGAPAAPASRWSRPLFALAASVVLIVGLGITAAVAIAQLTQPASVVALEKIAAAPDAQQATVEIGSGAEATAHWSASVGSAVLVTDGLAGLDEEQTYQLWLVRGDEALPAGLFETDGGTATALLDGAMHEGDVIAVTVEQAGGSPTGQPTTDPIIAIPTA